MPCSQWKESWVAHLYGELEPAELREMETHMHDCRACQARVEQLADASRLLRAVSPVAPPVPRVVVLRPGAFRHPVWAFAGGAACAVVLFGLGVAAGERLSRPVATPTAPLSAQDSASSKIRQAATEDTMLAVQSLERRLSQIESQVRGPAPTTAVLTRSQLDQEVTRLKRQIDRQRAHDLDYLMQAITDTEIRTGTWIDQTQTALQLLALKQDPRVAER